MSKYTGENSYSCMDKMEKLLTKQNKQILNKDNNNHHNINQQKLQKMLNQQHNIKSHRIKQHKRGRKN